MKKEEFLCDSCGNECVVEMFNLDDEVEYCPICGKSKDNSYEELLDWDE